MTEEIIIDGVDVAGCSLYLKDNGKCLRLLTDNEPATECNAICDYGCLYHKEQLNRLEQERDELKFENDRYKQLLKGCPTEDEDCGLCVIDEQNKRLKQENEELKKANEISIEKVTVTAEAKRLQELEQENKKMQDILRSILSVIRSKKIVEEVKLNAIKIKIERYFEKAQKGVK